MLRDSGVVSAPHRCLGRVNLHGAGGGVVCSAAGTNELDPNGAGAQTASLLQ